MPWHLLATSAVVYDFIVQGTITADILSDPGLRTTKEDFLACRHAEVLFYCPTSASADAVFIGMYLTRYHSNSIMSTVFSETDFLLVLYVVQ